MTTALNLLKTSAESRQNKEPVDRESLDTAAQRYAGTSATAGQLAFALNKAFSAIGHLVYREAQDDQEPASPA
ncbi:hypothetical protein ABZV34_24680 [Streptomyces sp. NPDC005195]|uniref:hypothetical protein n=1 Tax=Streptomyces sp. NPDC005195 TaxID=3154561 RepID=UPI0033B96FC0